MTETRSHPALLAPFRPALRAIRQFPSLWRAQKAARAMQVSQDPRAICYLGRRFPLAPPAKNEIAIGGEVKLTYLSELFPHNQSAASIVYLVSGMIPANARDLLTTLKRHGLKVVVNQDGVFYQAWYGQGWQARNEELRWIHDNADFVMYQSEFCAKAVEHFFGARAANSTVLLNPVDLKQFKSLSEQGTAPRLFTLSAGMGRAYRLYLAISVLAEILKEIPAASLTIAGYGTGSDDQAMKDKIHARCDALSVPHDRISFPSPYTRAQAPGLIAQSNILLHTALNDPCPNIVSECLACGLPVAYIDSGGVPELVGMEAGERVASSLSWEEFVTPEPTAMAESVLKIWKNWGAYSRAARAQAESKLNLESFISAHEQIFNRLVRAGQSLS